MICKHELSFANNFLKLSSYQISQYQSYLYYNIGKNGNVSFNEKFTSGKSSLSYLPSGGTVAVSFVFEVWDVGDHPLVHLTQGQPLLRGTLNGLSDQVCVGQVTPSISSRGTLLGRSRGR